MDLRETISDLTDVALTFTKHLFFTEAKQANAVFSPISIQVVLSLVAAGSKGATLDQLLSFLKSKSNDHLNSLSSELVSVVFADGSGSGGPRMSLVNGVWVDKSISLKDSFKHVVGNVYKAASDQVDFQTQAVEVTKQVNLWAEKETSGLINEVLPSGSVDSTTRLILANALYFKGAWGEKFDPSTTKDDDFYLLDGSSVRVPFMTSKKKQFVCTYDGFKVLKLRYKQGEETFFISKAKARKNEFKKSNKNFYKRQFSMYFFLPDAKDGLPALLEKVTSESRFLNGHLPYQKEEVGDFKIPKFKISFGLEASNALKQLGVPLPFSNEADLTEIAESVDRNLSVSSLHHKSVIEVNEEGTEAAAASAAFVVMGCSLRIPQKIDFVADHPFLFFIREDVTGVLLFVGQMLNPSVAN